MLDPLILKAISVGFGLLFLLAAIHKFSARQQFRVILEEYQLLPQGLVGPTARVIPVVEMILGGGWLFVYRPTLISVASAILLALYTAAIGVNLYRGRIHIGCGCSIAGSDENDQQLSFGLIVRNCALVAIALIAVFPAGTRELGVLDYITLLSVLLAGALLYATANQLLINGAAIGTWRNKHD